jgi:hypothetical protein
MHTPRWCCWTDQIASLRLACVCTRHQCTRIRWVRREGIGLPWPIKTRPTARPGGLRWTIGAAKRRAWDEHLTILNSDPWERPYREQCWTKTAHGRLPQRREWILDFWRRRRGLKVLRKRQKWGCGTERYLEPLEKSETVRLRIPTASGPVYGGISRAVNCEAEADAWSEVNTPVSGRRVSLPKPGRSPNSRSTFQSVCLLDEANK